MANKWDKRIETFNKFFQKALTHGQRVYERYEDERDSAATMLKRVNLFYSNANTIKQSLFNSLPQPDVSRMHKGDWEDDPSRVAALMLQRALHYEVQCAPNFEGAVSAAILNRLVPGIGTAWVRFSMPESIHVDTVFWEDFLYDPVRQWEDAQWCGRKLELTRKEVVERWGAGALEKLQKPTKRNDTNTATQQIAKDKFCIYEMWDKGTKTQEFTAVGLEQPLKVIPDPYQLPDFFPCPRPLIANVTTKAFLPVTDYHLSQDQYNQLDVLYARMGLIIDAIKVAGCYDASEQSTIGQMLLGQENKLVPVDNWAMYAEKGGAKGMIDWYPVETVVQVLTSLQASFDYIKGLLQEVSGMADIQRGDTNQYETAKAQQIKASFASVRMNGYQRDVAEFVRSLLRIMAAMMTKLYSDEKFMQIIGQLNEGDRQFVPQAAQIIRSNVLSMYKVDIQADSLTQADWSMDKDSKMELMGYISQYLAQALPAIQQTPQLGPLLMGLMKFTITGFKGSQEIEGFIDAQIAQLEAQVKAQQGQPKPPSPEEQKMMLERQKMAAKQQIDAQKAQQDYVLKKVESQDRQQLEATQARADMAVEQQKAALEAQMMQQKMDHDAKIASMELLMKERELEFKAKEAELKLLVGGIQHSQKLERDQQSHNLRMEKQNDKD